MDNTKKTVEERLAALEKQIAGIENREIANFSKQVERQAREAALFEAIVVLVDHLELDREAFITSFEGRRKYWHDFYLRGMENTSPVLGAMLDRRKPGDVSDVSDKEGFPGGDPPPMP